MKKYALLVLTILAGVVQLYAQKSSALMVKHPGITLNSSGTLPMQHTPLFIITADDKKLQLTNPISQNDSLALATTLDQINSSWIQSIAVLKDQEATDKYGRMGKYGVVLIELKNGMLDKMPVELSERFKVD